MDVDWYNQRLFADGAGLLPLRIAGVGGNPDDDQAAEGIAAQHFAHPAFTRFNDQQSGDLRRAVISTWHKLDAASAGKSAGPTIAARLSKGDPLAVEREFGSGRVLHVATACSDAWSNLPMRPFFVRLMQGLVTSVMANTMPDRNVPVGRPLVAYLDPQAVGQTMEISMPDGRRVPVAAVRDARGAAEVEFLQTSRPGLYVLGVASPIHFVVSADRSESKLEYLDEAELRQLASHLSADLVHNGDEYVELEQSRRFGQQWWKPLLAAAIALMFCEQIMTRRFSRSKG